ncbi:hypothetical protein CBOM_07699 [Ceraceosorus bombacis]|uniref:Uncharacterized protein n=1 Tax=Ceraceosorus bombacis TaxID=401625 RepID=A0A0P1BGW6_9BASI|nr:hypothetical protein CBOM_07699 [Ceraceosorus bombacis]
MRQGKRRVPVIFKSPNVGYSVQLTPRTMLTIIILECPSSFFSQSRAIKKSVGSDFVASSS